MISDERYFFEIEYLGKKYFGWQIQPHEITIQKEIQDVLYRLNSNVKVEIVGCGRTDTGVHANQYYFHADMKVKNKHSLLYKMNSMLPSDIVVKKITQVSQECHARFGANKRTYRYFVHFHKSAFKDDTSIYLNYALDFNEMNKAAKFLIGKKDFSCFTKSNSDVENHICEIFKAKWINQENEAFFEITANRFLRNMVRAIVGTLFDVGIGKIDIEKFILILNSKKRSEASTSAPARGLFLWKVEYPFDV